MAQCPSGNCCSLPAGECVIQLHAEQQALSGVRHQLLRVDCADGGLRHVRRAYHVRHMEVRHIHYFFVPVNSLGNQVVVLIRLFMVDHDKHLIEMEHLRFAALPKRLSR